MAGGLTDQRSQQAIAAPSADAIEHEANPDDGSAQELPFGGAPTQLWWARLGTFVIAMRKSPGTSFQAELADQIGKDSRVTKIKRPPSNSFWDTEAAFFPTRAMTTDALLGGSDLVKAARFGEPIIFTVNVPAKNQPTINGYEATADRFEVAWDGWSAVVAWKRAEDEAFPPFAAGQVVADILKDALEALEHDLLVQACSPWCEHLFAHTDMRVAVWSSPTWESEWTFDDQRAEVAVRLQGTSPTDEFVVVELLEELQMAASSFARMKNLARRVLDIEGSIQLKTATLLHHDYEALKRADVGLGERIKHAMQDAAASLRGEGRGRAVKTLIAELWLHMAAVGALRHQFLQAKRDYDDSLLPDPARALFDRDLKDDEAGVATLNLDFAQVAIDNKSLRLDNRGIVIATLVAAVVGSGIGAAVGGAFT